MDINTVLGNIILILVIIPVSYCTVILILHLRWKRRFNHDRDARIRHYLHSIKEKEDNEL